MPAALLRLLTALAVLWMPFGMAPAFAAAPAPMDHHSMAADKACHGDPAAPDKADKAQALCAAMCTVLPADAPIALPARIAVPVPQTLGVVPPLDTILLEIATPPPRLG